MFVSRASGTCIADLDGNEFTDYMLDGELLVATPILRS